MPSCSLNALRKLLIHSWLDCRQNYISRRTRRQALGATDSLEPRLLLAATLTRFDSAAGSDDFTNEFVRMDLGDFKVDIDTRFGGTPSRWYNGFDPNSVTNPFAGEGVTVMWDQGNDPTQGSANGPGFNPIARLDGQQLSYNYYARETMFADGGGNSDSVVYEVTGFAPFFWISHEAGDDAIPVESLSRWRTLYNNPGDANQIKSDPSVPIFYQAAGTTDGAVMFIGDDVVASGTSWSQRLAETREGRFAAKVRVSLQNASNDAIAGLMFRRQISDAVDVSEATAYSSPGYTLNVNKSGTLEIVRVGSQGAAPVAVWTSASGVAASTINTANGALLELRTHNANGNVEIFLNGISIGNYDDPDVLRGAHFGLFAQSSTGEIKFSDRQVFDVGTEYVAKYKGYENGVLETDIEIRNAGGVTSANQLYFAQMPIAFLAANLRQNAVARVYDATGAVTTEVSNLADPGIRSQAFRILQNQSSLPIGDDAYAFWLGSSETNTGIFAVPQAAWVNGIPSAGAHGQFDINSAASEPNNPNSGRYAISFNALPQMNPFPPTSRSQRNAVTSTRMVTQWRPKLEAIVPLLASISDVTVTEGDSGQNMATFTVSLNRTPTQIVEVQYETSPDTAVSGADYIATTGTVVFDPDDASLSQTVSVPIVADISVEPDESFKVNISAPKNAAIGDGEGTATIVNDDVVAPEANGTSGSDTFVLTYSGNTPNSTVNVSVASGGSAAQDVGTFPMSMSLALNGFGGTDSVRVLGSSLNDTFHVSVNGLSINGSHIVLNSIETRALEGRGGNDRYKFNGDSPVGSYSLFETGSGSGTDTIDLSETSALDVIMDLGTTAAQIVNQNLRLRLNSASAFEDLVGGAGFDTLTGNSRPNRITGNAGGDRIDGASGSDVFVGGSGNDQYIFKADAVAGEVDLIIEPSDRESDTLDFSALSIPVKVNISTGVQQTVHTNRSLTLGSGAAVENVIGGLKNDRITGNSRSNRLSGNEGNDIISGWLGSDQLIGGPGDDTYLFGGATAGGEVDTIVETASLDSDTLDFSSRTGAVTVNLAAGSQQIVHTDRSLILGSSLAIENVIGGSGNDSLSGNTRGNVLVGNGGNDTLIGNRGRDLLIGGTGLDTISGGDDEDILIAGRTTSDSNPANLAILLTGWQATTSYSARVGKLRAGVGSPRVSLIKKKTVVNDSGHDDQLSGGEGTDWFFRAADDVITDLVAGELIDLL